ncbi:MAG: ferrous iron transport protein A [Kiritimatiellaceae bacterium]|nr:ferrous iron transport protein A [Kiritimatiellaceae bacterium]
MFSRFFKKNSCQRQRCGSRVNDGICCTHPLSDFAQDARVVVVFNPDHKTLEMGLFSGALIHVIKNRPNDANMVISAGEGRYIISKEVAKQIHVR